MATLSMALASCGGGASSLASSETLSQGASSSAGASSSSLPVDTRGLSPFDYSLMNLTGLDAAKRRISRANNYADDKKLIGIFYSLWHGTHETGIYDVTKLESTEEGKAKLLSVADDNPDSPMGAFHFWGEPLFGYYNSADPYVIKRHLELFMDAGIDYLCIDATNDVVYTEATITLLKAVLAYQKEGLPVPKIVFYTNSFSGNTVETLYRSFYESGEYASAFLSIDGLKPLIIGITENNNNASDMTKYSGNSASLVYVTNVMQQYFDVRESEWPNGDYNSNSIPWMSWKYPQDIHETTGAVAVPVAQHSHSAIYVSSCDPECSRGYNNVTHQVEEDWTKGRSFQDMWDSATEREDQLSNLLCTSWNEWMAIKGKREVGGQEISGFVDVYDEEYSRDMEMENGVLKDNFYLQLLENSRRLNLTDYVSYRKPWANIKIGSDNSSLWKNVPSYGVLADNAAKRDFQGAVKTLSYKDETGRNDIADIKVAEDDSNLYFRIECQIDIISPGATDLGWMNILLGTDAALPSFEGFNYVINRSVSGKKASIEKSLGGYLFEKVGEAEINLAGKVLEVSIPRSAIGYVDGMDLEFKVTDNIAKPDDIMDYYVSGDSAPLGRLKFGY